MKRRPKLEEIKAKAQQKTSETKINKTSTNHTSQKMDQNQSTGQELLLWMADIKDEYILEAEDCKPQQAEKRVPGYLIAIGTFAAAAAIVTAVLMQSGRNWFNQDKNPIQLPVQTQESENIQETEWESETSTENVTEALTEGISTENQHLTETNTIIENINQQTQNAGEDWIAAVDFDGQETDFRIWEGNDEYRVEQLNSQNCIIKSNEKEGAVIYSEAMQSNSQESRLFLVGKYKDYIFFRNFADSSMQVDKALMVLRISDGTVVRRLDYDARYTMRYIQVDSDAIITNVPDNGYGPLYLTDLNTGEEEILATHCRMIKGDYIKDHVLYFLEPSDETYTQFHLIGYDLQKREVCQDMELPFGTYEAWRGCFIRSDGDNGNKILLYDGTEYAYDGISNSVGSSLNRFEGKIIDYKEYLDENNELKKVLRILNEDTGEWKEWVDLSEYGVMPASAYSIKLEKGQNNILLRYLDANQKEQTVELYETLEESQTAEETIWMPQYQVRYPAQAEVMDALWNWLVEYGCLEPYQKIQQYYEEYRAAHPAYNQGELYCYPGKVASLSYGGGDQIIIGQNNMEYSYTGPAIYSKEELPQELQNIYRYASYQYGDYSLSKNLEKLDLEECSRTEAADYCNGIMKQYGYEFASVDVYTITYEHIQEIVNDPRYKEWCFAPGYDPVNQTGGEWREGDDAYLIVYRDLSWNDRPIQVSEYASWNYAIYSPRYGLVWMTIQYPPEYLGEMQCAIISEEEALKEAEIKFKKEFADVETIQILSSEVVYSLDSDNRNNATYEYGNEWQGTFSPYWKVTFSMASMFSDVNVENAEQPQPVVDILVPAVQ